MPQTLSCSCGKQLRVKDELAGKKVKCPGCGSVLTAPAAAPVAPVQVALAQKPADTPNVAFAPKNVAASSGPLHTETADSLKVWTLPPGIFENVIAVTDTVFCAAKLSKDQASEAEADLRDGVLPRKALGPKATIIALDAIRDVAVANEQSQLIITHLGDDGKEKKILHIADDEVRAALSTALRNRMRPSRKVDKKPNGQAEKFGRVATRRSSRNDDDAAPTPPVPKILYCLAVLPLGIPIITLGGIIPAVWGGALASAGFALAKRSGIPVVMRVFGLLGITVIGYVGLGVFLVAVAMLSGGDSRLRDWWEDFTRRPGIQGPEFPDPVIQDDPRPPQPAVQTHVPMEPGGLLLKIHDKDVMVVTMSPLADELASATVDKVILSNGYTGAPILQRPGGTPSLAFTPDGKRLVYRDLNRNVTVWDFATMEVLKLKFVGEAFALSPDGKRLATGRNDQIQIHDFATGSELASQANVRMSIDQLMFSPDGKTLAVMSGSQGEVALCDGVTGKVLRTCVPERGMSNGSMCFGPGGEWLAVSGWDEPVVRLADVKTGQTKRVLKAQEKEHIWTVAISPDATVLATGNRAGLVRLWDAALGKEIAVLRGGLPVVPPPTAMQPYGVRSLAFSPDGKTLVAGAVCGDVRRWDVEKVIGRVPGRTR